MISFWRISPSSISLASRWIVVPPVLSPHNIFQLMDAAPFHFGSSVKCTFTISQYLYVFACTRLAKLLLSDSVSLISKPPVHQGFLQLVYIQLLILSPNVLLSISTLSIILGSYNCNLFFLLFCVLGQQIASSN